MSERDQRRLSIEIKLQFVCNFFVREYIFSVRQMLLISLQVNVSCTRHCRQWTPVHTFSIQKSLLDSRVTQHMDKYSRRIDVWLINTDLERRSGCYQLVQNLSLYLIKRLGLTYKCITIVCAPVRVCVWLVVTGLVWLIVCWCVKGNIGKKNAMNLTKDPW